MVRFSERDRAGLDNSGGGRKYHKIRSRVLGCAGLRDALFEVENFGVIYRRKAEESIARTSWNALNSIDDGGLLYAVPFGDSSVVGSDPTSDSVIASILERGFVRCAIASRPCTVNIYATQSETNGFIDFNTETSSWEGFDVEFCMAVGAALFGEATTSNTVLLINIY